MTAFDVGMLLHPIKVSEGLLSYGQGHVNILDILCNDVIVGDNMDGHIEGLILI